MDFVRGLATSTSFNGTKARDAIRVSVKLIGSTSEDSRKFSVDPHITNVEVLRSIIVRAFDIQGHFVVHYLARDKDAETYVKLLSDWDLDAAFLGSCDPFLHLRVENRPPSPDRPSLTETLRSQVERTFSMVQKALVPEVPVTPLRPPLSDAEFRALMDGEGVLINRRDVHNAVFLGGIEASLRRAVWKHLLNVYPDGLTGKQRISYMKSKSDEYVQLRNSWRESCCTEQQQYIEQLTNMVTKDVLRTDRTHTLYSGSDDNSNVVALDNILSTYAIHHPTVSYCQGMSDLASPLLATMQDEAHAYVCFCALMRRLRTHFLPDGKALSLKFEHLALALKVLDSQFYAYLKAKQAEDLLFCYRWLILELKREFVFDEALHVLEVLWASLPPDPPEPELSLIEHTNPFVDFSLLSGIRGVNVGSPTTRSNPFLSSGGLPQPAQLPKVRAMHRQSSESSSRHSSQGSSSDDINEQTSLLPNASYCEEVFTSLDDHQKGDGPSPGGPNTGRNPLALRYRLLPPPDKFGGGHPFLMFVCVALLTQQRDRVMQAGMDYNDLAMHFDKLIRRPSARRVLQDAREMYAEYMKHQKAGWSLSV